MASPAQIVWEAHGQPPASDTTLCEAHCYLCAAPTARGVPVADWMGSNFTSQTLCRAPSSAWVCEACIYITSRTSPVIGRDAKEGKKFGGSFRNYSHLWDERGYLNASKGEKPLLREFLARIHTAPWFAALADSGQKHVLPFAQMNGPGRTGVVLFDEVRVPIPDDQSLVGDCTALLTAGATKEELASGDYSSRAWQLCGSTLATFEATYGPHRGGAWFSLAIWLAQRDEAEVAVRQAAEKEAKRDRGKDKRVAEDEDRGTALGTASGISRKSRKQQSEALGHPDGETSGCRANDSEPRGVGHEDAARPKPVRPKQLRLPGAD